MLVLASTEVLRVAAPDYTLLAVSALVLALVLGGFLLFRKRGDDEPVVDYSDDAYDPVAAAEMERQRAVEHGTQVDSGPEEDDAPSSTADVSPEPDEQLRDVRSEPTPELAVDTERVAAEKKAAFAARKLADAEESAERKLRREQESEQAAEKRQELLSDQRQDFESERRAAYRIGLSKTKKGLFGKIAGILNSSSAIDDQLMDELEAVLFTSDIGTRTADRLLEELKIRRKSERLKTPQEVVESLREQISKVIDLPNHSLFEGLEPGKTKVVMVVGVNGVGKTTSIGKLAHAARQRGHSVLLGAGDTFRAAAVEQLEVWAQRSDCELVRGADGVDPSSVLFDAVKQGVEKNVELVICDTAGRLHTRAELMDELKKMYRVMGKAAEGAPHEVILVLDATIGQNAIAQARTFVDAVPVDGIILTKLDGTARGGVIAGICDELKIPVRYIGVGEGLDDLRAFVAADFVDALFDSVLETA